MSESETTSRPNSEPDSGRKKIVYDKIRDTEEDPTLDAFLETYSLAWIEIEKLWKLYKFLVKRDERRHHQTVDDLFRMASTKTALHQRDARRFRKVGKVESLEIFSILQEDLGQTLDAINAIALHLSRYDTSTFRLLFLAYTEIPRNDRLFDLGYKLRSFFHQTQPFISSKLREIAAQQSQSPR